MVIGYDGSRAFVEEATGTENYSLNLLLALAKIDRKNKYRVYLRSGSKFRVNSSQTEQDQNPVATVNREPETVDQSSVNSELITKNFNWPKNFEFVEIGPSRLWTQVGLALETWRNPPDVLFIGAHTLPILSTLARPRLARLRRMKTVVTIHDLGVEYLPRYHQFPQRYYLDWACRYAAAASDAIIAVSAATRADLIKRYGVDSKKIFVTYEGVDRAFFRPKSKREVQNVKIKYQIEGDYVLFVGTVQPRKNLERLIEAFSILVHSNQLTVHRKAKAVNREPLTSNINLVIAGKLGWHYQEILAAPKKFGVFGRVKFLGYVPRKDLPTLYTGAAVLAAPSLFEGFDLPILEAMACGCGVIASDIGAHREILYKISRNFKLQAPNSKNLGFGNWDLKIPTSREVGKAMILLKPDDIDGWASVLYQSITNGKLRQTFVSKLRARVANYSWEEAAKRTLAVFGRVLG